jgi:hypothetical protein
MPMAACRVAEWAGWICKKDGRAQRAFRRLSYAVFMLRTRTVSRVEAAEGARNAERNLGE